jgi:hypothetical protein
MEPRLLFKLSAAAAAIGGVLRLCGVFFDQSTFGPQLVQQLYFLTDVALMFGAMGIYGSLSGRVGVTGMIGFVVFVFGILLVRSANVSFFGAGGYRTGAAVALLGIACLGTAMLAVGASRVGPILWLGALAAGIAGAVFPAAGLFAAGAGILFSAGFLAAGWNLARAT